MKGDSSVSAISAEPFQICIGIACGFVFRPERCCVTQRQDRGKDMSIVDFAVIGCGAVGNGCELDMPDDGQVGAQAVRQVALHALDVIAVEHQFEVGLGEGRDDLGGLVGGGEEITGRIMAVEGFDQDGDAMRDSLGAGIVEVFKEGFVGLGASRKTCHDVDIWGMNGAGIGDGLINSRAGLWFAPRQGAKPILARIAA